MKVVVTGGAGFIGSHLVDALLTRHYDVVVIDDLSTGNKKNISSAAKFYKVDVRADKVRGLLKKIAPDYVCHLAAQISVALSQMDAASDAAINILGSLNLAEAARHLPIKKFLFVSTGGAIYGDRAILPTPETEIAQPQSAYGLAKHTVERYLEYYALTFGLPVAVARLANVYGPRQISSAESGVVSIFSEKILKGDELSVHGGGTQTRDYIYVQDVVDGLLQIMEKGRGVYNLGTGIETSVLDLAKIMGKLVGEPPRVKYSPPRSSVEIERSVLKYDKVSRELGWRPTYRLTDGLQLTLDWFKKEIL